MSANRTLMRTFIRSPYGQVWYREGFDILQMSAGQHSPNSTLDYLRTGTLTEADSSVFIVREADYSSGQFTAIF